MQVRVRGRACFGRSGLNRSPASFCRHVFVPAVLDSSLPARVVGSERTLRFCLWTSRSRSLGTNAWKERLGRSLGTVRSAAVVRPAAGPVTVDADGAARSCRPGFESARGCRWTGTEGAVFLGWAGVGSFLWPGPGVRRGSRLPARRRLCRRLGSGARGFDPAGLVGAGRRGGALQLGLQVELGPSPEESHLRRVDEGG